MSNNQEIILKILFDLMNGVYGGIDEYEIYPIAQKHGLNFETAYEAILELRKLGKIVYMDHDIAVIPKSLFEEMLKNK